MSPSAFEEIRTSPRLPSPAGVALEILRLVDEEATTAAEIAAVLESDPALSGRLIQLVNSSASGLSRSVASVKQAVTLLGLRTVKVVALSFSLVDQHLQGASPGFDYDAYWTGSLAHAAAMRSLAHRVRLLPPDEAFTCGLLSSIGRLALATVFPERFAEVATSLAGDDPKELDAALEVEFGIHPDLLSSYMLRDWGFPPIFSKSLARHYTSDGESSQPSREQQLARVMRASDVLAEVITQQECDQDVLARLAVEAYRLGVEPGELPVLFEEAAQSWREAGRVLSIPTRTVPSLGELYSRAALRADALRRADDGETANIERV